MGKAVLKVSARVDEIICLLVTEALELEQNSSLDFVGCLNKVQMSVSAKVIEIMKAERASERLKKEKNNA